MERAILRLMLSLRSEPTRIAILCRVMGMSFRAAPALNRRPWQKLRAARLMPERRRSPSGASENVSSPTIANTSSEIEGNFLIHIRPGLDAADVPQLLHFFRILS